MGQMVLNKLKNIQLQPLMVFLSLSQLTKHFRSPRIHFPGFSLQFQLLLAINTNLNALIFCLKQQQNLLCQITFCNKVVMISQEKKEVTNQIIRLYQISLSFCAFNQKRVGLPVLFQTLCKVGYNPHPSVWPKGPRVREQTAQGTGGSVRASL